MELRLLSQSEIDFFHSEGYLIVKNVYDPETMNRIRHELIKAFDDGLWKHSVFDSPTILNDLYRHFPDIARLVFNQKYFDAVQDILNDSALWIPECSIHYNRFISWHKDTTEQEVGGIKNHYHFDELILQCATYFQDNNIDGGGLTIVPRSHKGNDPFVLYYKKSLTYRALSKFLKNLPISIFNRLENHPKKTDLKTQLGDLLIFDVRLNHRSTFAKQVTGKMPGKKLAIFNTFIQESKAGMDYFNYMKKRSEPYYRFFKEVPLAPVIYARANELNMKILY